jgi:hypothetical protein
MAFQIKNFVSIIGSMMNRMKATQLQLTDFNRGAVGRTMIEAPAIEIDQLYQQMFNGLVEAIPVSVYQSFNFPPLAAIGASGTIQLTIASSLTSTDIPLGTLFKSTSTSTVYASTADVIIPPSTTVAYIPVAATSTGSATNLVVDVAFTLTPSPNNFSMATNLAPFINGLDAEMPADQQSRFNAFIASLPRGIITALSYGMSLANVKDVNGNIIEQVRYSNIVEPWLTDNTQPVSLVNCYIHNGIGSTSSTLQTNVETVLFGSYDPNGIAIPGYKAAGVKVNVYIASEVTVAVTGVITALPGYSKTDTIVNGATVPGLITLATAAVSSYLLTRGINQSALMAEINALVMNITGVYNYVPSLPASDVTTTISQKIMPGVITLT